MLSLTSFFCLGYTCPCASSLSSVYASRLRILTLMPKCETCRQTFKCNRSVFLMFFYFTLKKGRTTSLFKPVAQFSNSSTFLGWGQSSYTLYVNLPEANIWTFLSIKYSKLKKVLHWVTENKDQTVSLWMSHILKVMVTNWISVYFQNVYHQFPNVPSSSNDDTSSDDVILL